jgi:protochlorophyllide reductase
MGTWSEKDIPDQSGRTALVTGANSGLGLRISQVLATHGARVLMASRSADRGAAAVGGVQGAELVVLDLADLRSVRAAAARVREMTGDRVDVLVNNAGVMATPHKTTVDGFELQFGTNHLGHAALTWLLMPALSTVSGARVVTMSSTAARGGRMDVADPNFEHRRYTPATAYAQAKVANLLFALELDRRATTAGLRLVSVAAHPGFTATNLLTNMANTHESGLLRGLITVGDAFVRFVAQDVSAGALPALFAATAGGVRGGDYYGPDGMFETRGASPGRAHLPRLATDREIAARLWERTAELTDVQPDPA